MAKSNLRSDRGRAPIAEIAQLIGHPRGESVPADNEPLGLPPAPQPPGYLNTPEQAHEFDEPRYDDRAYGADDQPCAVDEEYPNEAPRVRSLTLVVAIFGLALVGTAGAFGYRDMFGGSALPRPPPTIKASNEPNKIAPVSSEPQTKSSGNASQVETTGSIANLVSREEQPLMIKPPKPAPPGTVDVAAVSNRTNLNAAPMANVNYTAEVSPSVLGSGYAVQVTSERSESAAQAAFRALQAKYPNQLSGRQPTIRRADLGAAGTYYRALVGPFASAEKAARLCSGLKAAGGNCIIQKN